MRMIASLSLYAWVPFVLLLFTMMKPRRAILVAFIGGWLFLPMLAIPFKGMPDLSKLTASSIGVLLGVLLFDTKRLYSFRPKWFDIPIAAWCFTPFVTSMQNDLGTWDAMSNVIGQLFLWGLPYFLGRLYFSDWEGLRELGIAIFVGGLIYMPFCWFEMRLSPRLHNDVYGFRQHSHLQTIRWGGYRPMVFMQSGLALAMWMITASLVGTWLWVTGSVKKLWNVPMWAWVGVLLATTVACKSLGALLLLGMGLAALFWVKWFRNPVSLLVLVMIPPAYMYTRGSGEVTGDWAVEQSEALFGADRAKSLFVRFDAENKLSERAAEAPSPAFGWGRWDPATGRAPWRIWAPRLRRDPAGIEYTIYQDMAITDGMWIITLGTYGWVGLTALTVTLLLPILIAWRRCPLKYWSHPLPAAAVALAVLLGLHMIDNLLNAMLNPIFIMALGGICAAMPSLRKPANAAMLLGGAPVVPAYGAFPVVPPGYYAPAGVQVNTGYANGPVAGFPQVAGLRAPQVQASFRAGQPELRR